VKTASEMTYTVSGGALNSTQTKPKANACLLSVPRTRTTYGDRSFAVSGPVASNSLPVALRSSVVTEETFRRRLKTFLFNYLDN